MGNTSSQNEIVIEQQKAFSHQQQDYSEAEETETNERSEIERYFDLLEDPLEASLLFLSADNVD